MEDLKELLEDIGMGEDNAKPRPIKTGKGLIAYRKYLWALKFIEEKILRLQTYKQEVIEDIDKNIETQLGNIARIKGEIEKAIIVDPIADRTKTGGRTLSLPDIATVSLSKLKDKIKITNPNAVLDELGDEFKKVKVSLDVIRAKNHIKETGIVPVGAISTQGRTLSIRFKR